MIVKSLGGMHKPINLKGFGEYNSYSVMKLSQIFRRNWVFIDTRIMLSNYANSMPLNIQMLKIKLLFCPQKTLVDSLSVFYHLY